MSAKIPSETFVGKSFGNFIIVEALPNKNGYRYIMAKCICGSIKSYMLDNIVGGRNKFCGCVKDRHKKHGLIDHPLYWVYHSMLDRCYKESSHAYKYYGARGVRVCEEWRSDFKLFYNWCINNGWNETIEIDKDIKGNGLLYSPMTCSFVTTKQNCNKRRSSLFLTYKGETKTAAQWSDIYGISQQVFYKRRKRGWSIEKCLETPPMINKYLFKT